MAIIAPSSKIKIMKDIPFNDTYKYTTKFASESAQITYFNSKVKFNVDDCMYLRKEQVIRVPYVADDLLDCNYIAFQNVGYGRKWFYAFITNVEYVNDSVSNISYKLDVMQTWQFDYEVKPSFVEREHPSIDTIGSNTIPENLETGEYTYTDLGISSLFNLYQIVVASTFDESFNSSTGGMYGGVYSGLTYNVFSTFSDCNEFLEQATTRNLSDGIVSIFMLPIAFCYDYQQTLPDSFVLDRDKQHTHINGYVPRNKKLFTYPYNMLYVTNNEGLSANYPFEFFSSNNCTFQVTGAMCATPEVMMTPLNYKGCSKNYNESLTVGNFPQCAYNIDTFKAFIAQNAMKLTVGAVTDIGKVVGGGAMAYATGGMMGGEMAVQGGMSILNTLATVYDKSTLPPQSRGGHSSIINMANEIKGFQFYYCQIRAEYARIIDEYFDVYGYATHRVKVPNINTRPYWNYVKTIDVTIVGSVPSDDLETIRRVHDSGVTFWKNPNQIGDYTLNNSI